MPEGNVKKIDVSLRGGGGEEAAVVKGTLEKLWRKEPTRKTDDYEN